MYDSLPSAPLMTILSIFKPPSLLIAAKTIVFSPAFKCTVEVAPVPKFLYTDGSDCQFKPVSPGNVPVSAVSALLTVSFIYSLSDKSTYLRLKLPQFTCSYTEDAA